MSETLDLYPIDIPVVPEPGTPYQLKLYKHDIHLHSENSTAKVSCTITLITDRSYAYTDADLRTYMQGKFVAASGVVNQSGTTFVVVYVKGEENTLHAYTMQQNGNMLKWENNLSIASYWSGDTTVVPLVNISVPQEAE